MKRATKVLSLTAAATMLFGSTAYAMPNNTVVLGNKAYAIDALFNGVPTNLQADIDAAGERLYYHLDGQTSDFVRLFGGQQMTQAEKDALSDILYTDADGNQTTYPVFNQPSTPPPGGKVAVTGVAFKDYRHIQVSFSGLVDHASAENPSHYYMEIVDGNAQIGAQAIVDLPTLQDSNQLSMIQTWYPGDWWENHIIATDVNGKTIVDIYLPEDARFTNVVDADFGNYPFEADDAERTLAVKQQTAKDPYYSTLKPLTKDVSVNVAVRNVSDTQGKRTIDTAVYRIGILDKVRPELLGVNVIDTPAWEDPEPSATALGQDLGSFELFRSDKQQGQSLQFVYSEPVFDAHHIDMSDTELPRDIKLTVDGTPVASLLEGNLHEYMTFQMGVDSTYSGARTVILDAEAAVKAVYGDRFATGVNYRIRFVGVTDLAGNIEVESEHSVVVKFKDKDVVPPPIVKPVVLGVVQVADNVFRVEYNRPGVESTFVIENPDGEGGASLKVDVPRSIGWQADEDSPWKYYSYVAVPARDNEPAAAIPEGVFQNQALAYDGMDNIYRNIRVEDVIVPEDEVSIDPLLGDDYIQNQRNLKNDILAPVVIDPTWDIEYADRGTKLWVSVKDMIPWAEDVNVPHWVSPIAYVYNGSEMRFENVIVDDQENADTYLPVKVSYVDADGAKHVAMVSNYDLRPYPGSDYADWNEGSPGSIMWTPNTIQLDLSEYPQLLDADGLLVAGATYTVEFPSGYFTDAPKDTRFERYRNGEDVDFSFGVNGYDILNVDDARKSTRYDWPEPIDAGLGFTSSSAMVDVKVKTKPVPPVDPGDVPQTSKQLITYDEPTKSLRIEFTGKIDVATLKNKANYAFNGKTLAEWDQLLGTNTQVEYVVNDADPENVRQYAVFVVPQDSVEHDGDVAFHVSGVAHPNGGKMTPVDTDVKLRDNYRPVVETAIVTGDKQIKLTFKEEVRYHVDPALKADPHSTARNFVVKVGGQTLTVDNAVLPGGPEDKVVILNLGSLIPAEGTITVQIVKDQNGNILVIDMSENKNPMREATYTVSR